MNPTNRYICLHGHFYQPPRENPWLEAVELQDSAYPYHDWNERITAECYAPNTASRILNKDKKIVKIINNYSNMSFNFGPTLLSWLEKYAPDTYQMILEADQESQKRFSGHGGAIAQVYNHMIMPLANSRDKYTQTIWGIKDFEYRFKRKPEGMWLAETAVDVESLEVLAEYGIKFTILAPHQAVRTRKIGNGEKEDEDSVGQGVDPQMPYLCRLPSGRSIVIFFYDGPISQEVAFSGLLKDGDQFARRLLGVFPAQTKEPRLVHIATDGETYGHHHRFADMALAYCLEYIETNKMVHLTNYGEYLEKFPPTHEVEISEYSSWSCAHGVERWRANCGCNSGSHQGWSQRWRGPLREALDWLRDVVAAYYEREILPFTDDAWGIRDRYIQVMLDRSPSNVEKFFAENVSRRLSKEEHIKLLKLLEMQRHAMLMYTSCGWFFDEISGIETVQIIQYAAQVIQLADELLHKDYLEKEFKALLEKAPSNKRELKNGAAVYEKFAKPGIIDLPRVGAHYAMSSLFNEFLENSNIYCYSVHTDLYEHQELGKNALVTGRALIKSSITWEEQQFFFAVFHQGDHNLIGGIKADTSGENFHKMKKEIVSVFQKNDDAEVLRLVHAHFGEQSYTLKDLFKDEQKRILEKILHSTLDDLEALFRQIYDQYYPMLQARDNVKVSLPKYLANVIEFVINRDLMAMLREENMNVPRLQKIVEQVTRWNFEIDRTALSYVASKKVNRLMGQLSENPQDLALLKSTESLLRVVTTLPLDLNLWKAQNIYFDITQNFPNGHLSKMSAPPTETEQRLQLFQALGDLLQVQNE